MKKMCILKALFQKQTGNLVDIQKVHTNSDSNWKFKQTTKQGMVRLEICGLKYFIRRCFFKTWNLQRIIIHLQVMEQ